MKLTDYLAKRLVDYGVADVFMISGGGAMHLVDSVGSNKRLRYWCTHHEQAAAIAAEGYARASGKMGVVVVTSGPGGTNTITGVIGQWLDSIPCLYVSGQVKRETTILACAGQKPRQLGDQEINIVDIVKPVTKYAVMITDENDIAYHLDKAFYLATHGRPGPVWLDIPLDIQAARIDPGRLRKYNEDEDALHYNAAAVRGAVSLIVERFRRSERPVLFAGNGIRLSGAENEFSRLVRTLGVPVVTGICGNGLIDFKHRLSFGIPGVCGDRLANIVVQNSDLLLSIGARLGVRQISYNYEAFARKAYRVMVDIDAAELDKPTLSPHVKIHADAGMFIREMLRQLGGKEIAEKKAWLGWCSERRRTLPDVLAENESNPRFVNSYAFARELFHQLDPHSVVVTGNGTAYTGTLQGIHAKKGVRVIANQGCASMGYDLPAAIGASIARGKKPITLITGDGSIQMNIQELQTIVHNALPMKIFVLNNDGYLAIRTTQDTYFQGRYIASSVKGGVSCPDICRIGQAYGIKTIRIRRKGELGGRIREVLAYKGPVICEIMMDPRQTLLPKLASKAMPDGRLISKPLEDMFPFLPREEFKKHMIIDTLDE